MIYLNYSNTAPPVTLTVAIGNLVGDTSLTVASTASYPVAPFLLALERGTPNEEVVLCTAVPDATHFTVERGYDGTTRKSHAIGATVEHTVAALTYRGAGIVRVTTTQRNALAGDNLWAGRMIWNTTTAQHEFWTGSAWVASPEVSSFTTTERDALTGGQLWVGRLIYNTTLSRYESWSGSAWGALIGTKTVRIPHTWHVPGEVKVPSGDTDFILPFFLPEPATQVVTIVGCRHRINSGTSATVKLTLDGTDVTGFTALSVTTTSTTTDPTDVAVADAQALALVVTAVSGTPKNLTFTVWLDYAI